MLLVLQNSKVVFNRKKSFTLSDLKCTNCVKFEFWFLSCISHISSAEKPHVVVYSIGQSISLHSEEILFLTLLYSILLHKGLYCFLHNCMLCLCRDDHNFYNQSFNDGYLIYFSLSCPFTVIK